MFRWFRRKPKFVIWCNICNAEPANAVIETYLDNEWQPVDVGKECLTKLRAAGKI